MRTHHLFVLATAVVGALCLSVAVAQQNAGQPQPAPGAGQQTNVPQQQQQPQGQQQQQPIMGGQEMTNQGMGGTQQVTIAEQPVEVTVIPGRPTIWDYDVLVILAPSNPQEGQRIQADLARRGQAGWELVDSFANNGVVTMVFKRPRQ